MSNVMNKPLTKKEDIALHIPELLEKTNWLMKIGETSDGITVTVCEKQEDDAGKYRLKKYGTIYGTGLRSSRDAIYYMLSRMEDELGNPTGLQVLFDGRITYRGDVPLDKTIGHKMALLSILLPTMKIEKKAEVVAWRVERMTIEEVMYWLSKVTIPSYGERAMKWAIIGLRVMLAGPTDQKENFDDILEKLRK